MHQEVAEVFVADFVEIFGVQAEGAEAADIFHRVLATIQSTMESVDSVVALDISTGSAIISK